MTEQEARAEAERRYPNDRKASVKSANAIAAILGQGSASGGIGSWLVLTERDASLNILGVQAVRVDGKKLKPDTFYTLKGGKVVEVE